VSVELFGDFVKYLNSKQLPDVNPANAKTFYLLSQEFGLFDLSSQCGRLISDGQTVGSDLPSTGEALFRTNSLNQASEFESFRRDFPFCVSNSLFSRLGLVEHKVDILSCDFESRLRLCSSNCEELRCAIPQELSTLESRLENDLSDLKSTCDEFRTEIDELTSIPRVFRLNPKEPLKGIICELTRKHDGNLHDKGIVLLTSKSHLSCNVKNLVDLASHSDFTSSDEPSQWVRWEFPAKLVRPTHYTIQSAGCYQLKSWLIEGSMDGESWTELDRRKNDSHLKANFAIHSFDVKSLLECRFLRLTQTGKNDDDTNNLSFCSLEIFGSLRFSPLSAREFPLKEARSLDGIISYLTRKYGGNVHDARIVTLTSRSVYFRDPENISKLADLTYDMGFYSGDCDACE
jgi:hypothetical protein